ncbi:hypothetical protein [Bradyrhizobium cajani]|uniref:Uncharacterized protein n=1 Tax=Bradyrhizobium cajani TaxID=1928661 RepID=A0A844TTR5_9BRAD|nr:hypothetical protein [Bradyrhizobium cajani]MCP3369892.1 hypothetical protein [Bradyrhizobium cajani]MVT78020.1 hypothetical protein [Bradyrhizobium cajani]
MSQDSPVVGDNALKILTFAGPLLASSLAVTYDVGFFVGIGLGFFSFFSLSEHLVFALQSLPFAIPPVAVLLFWSTSGWYGYRLGYRDGFASARGDAEPQLGRLGSLVRACAQGLRSMIWIQRLWTGFMVLFIIHGVWRGQYTSAFLLSCMLLYLANAQSVHEAWKTRAPALMAACAIASLILSFLIGLQRANTILNSQEPTEKIGIDDKVLPARLVRGGDKGLLFFSLDDKKIRFLRWESVKQIETL